MDVFLNDQSGIRWLIAENTVRTSQCEQFVCVGGCGGCTDDFRVSLSTVQYRIGFSRSMLEVWSWGFLGGKPCFDCWRKGDFSPLKAFWDEVFVLLAVSQLSAEEYGNGFSNGALSCRP